MFELKIGLKDILHLNNFVFLVFSYCTYKVTDLSLCDTDIQKHLLKFVFYGKSLRKAT